MTTLSRMRIRWGLVESVFATNEPFRYRFFSEKDVHNILVDYNCKGVGVSYCT